VTEAEELLKDDAKHVVAPIAEEVVETAKDTDITHDQLVDLMMLKSMADPSGQFAGRLSDKAMAEFKP
jgi:hypothetical protein